MGGLARIALRRGDLIGTALVLAVAIGLRIWPLGGASTDYDEGVYWQTLRAMDHGKSLFDPVFSSQPPLFSLGTYPIYAVLGHSLTSARAAVAIYSIVGLVAIYLLARMIGGRWIALGAVALLAADPLYLRESYTLQAEAPSVSLELVALLLAVAGYKASGAGRRWFAVGAGIVLGLGVMTKLLSVVAALPIAFLLLAGGVRGRATNLVMAVVAGLFAIVLVLLPFLGSWPTVYQQLVGMHVAATDLSNVSSSVQVFRLTLNTEWPLVLLAAAGTAVLVIRRSSLAIALLIWGSASFVLLVTHKPLFLHHMVYLVPALVLIPVAAIRPSLELLTASPNIVRGWPAAVASCLVAVMAFGWLVGFVQARNAATASVRSAAVARLLASASQPGDFVVTDNQYVAALANRDVPPQLVDTSRVRIESGNLDASLLERVTLASGARIILFDTDRLDRVRGFRDWVAQRFHLVDDVGGGTWLYRR